MGRVHLQIAEDRPGPEDSFDALIRREEGGYGSVACDTGLVLLFLYPRAFIM